MPGDNILFKVFDDEKGNTSKKDPYRLWGIDNYGKPELDALRARRDAGDKTAILSVCVSMTRMCNVRCWYCYALHNKSVNPEQLSLEEYEDLIEQSAQLGAKTMIICGDGEPTYDRKLLPVMRMGAERGMKPVLVTNGTIMGHDNLAKQLHGVDARGLTQAIYDTGASLLVKLETLDPALYEQILDVPNIWEKFERGVQNIVDVGFGKTWKEPAGTYTRLSFTGICTRQNKDEIPKMLSWARERGGQYICKVPSPTGGALEHTDDYLFGPAEVHAVRDYIAELSDKRETLTPIVLDADKCMTCLAWHLGPVITEDGHYVECYTSTTNKFGNIREKSLAELIGQRGQDTGFDNPCPIKDRLYSQLMADEQGKDPSLIQLRV